MANYFKMNNYCYTFIVMIAIVSDNRELQGYAVTHEVFRRLANQIQGQICVMLEFCVYHGLGGVIPIPT